MRCESNTQPPLLERMLISVLWRIPILYNRLVKASNDQQFIRRSHQDTFYVHIYYILCLFLWYWVSEGHKLTSIVELGLWLNVKNLKPLSHEGPCFSYMIIFFIKKNLSQQTWRRKVLWKISLLHLGLNNIIKIRYLITPPFLVYHDLRSIRIQ